MSILVLGSTGKTGSEVIKQLKEIQVPFYAFARSEGRAKTLGLPNDQIRIGDFSDKSSLVAAMQGIKSVYLAMAPHQDNQEWVKNVLAAAKSSGVSHLVKLSGLNAQEETGAEIIRVHAYTDKLIQASGIDYTLIQPNAFYQNLFASVDSIKSSGQFFVPAEEAKQSAVDVRDVAAVVVSTLTEQGHRGKVYRLTGPESLSFSQQAAILSQHAGFDIHYISVPVEAARQAMESSGMSPWLAKHVAEILAWFARGGYEVVTSDIEKILGRPATSFETFAKEFVPYIR